VGWVGLSQVTEREVRMHNVISELEFLLSAAWLWSSELSWPGDPALSQVSSLRWWQSLELAWVGPLPGHYKHGQFLCLSCPPCSAQRKGVARADIRRCAPLPLPCRVTRGFSQQARLGVMGGDSTLWVGRLSIQPTLGLLRDPMTSPALAEAWELPGSGGGE
jgi:hypothetical protein